MFCPKCGTYLKEDELVQRNVTLAVGVAVEFDARCPRCSEDIGHVSWGRFTVHPELVMDEYAALERPRPGQESLIPPPPEIRPLLRRRKASQAAEATEAPLDAPEVPAEPAKDPGAGEDALQLDVSGEGQEAEGERICPHCGQLWPLSVEEQWAKGL